jgi:hypothetical protein
VLLSLRRALLLTALLAGAGALAAPGAAPRGYAAEVPGGALRVLVLPEDARLPAGGLRIEDEGGHVLAAQVGPDGATAAGLDAGAQQALRALRRLPGVDAEHAATVNALLLLRLVSDWNFARAAGLGVELPAGTAAHSLRAVLLDAQGRALQTLGPWALHRDAGPPAAAALRARLLAPGIGLQWQPPAAGGTTVPVLAFVVARSSGSATESLTPRPQLLAAARAGQPASFLDRAAPVGTELGYELRLVDLLGVVGPPASARMYSPDLEAQRPPAGLTARVEHGRIRLSWSVPADTRSAGWAVERAQLRDGPYELILAQGLAPQAAQYEDREILAGANYYYRVRALAADGSLGPAPEPVHAQALAGAPPAAPEGLAAVAGPNDVALSWQPVPGAAIAGYVVERRADSAAPRWSRLNERLLPTPHLRDAVGPGAGGQFDYRVLAVAADESVSAPSAVLTVSLRATVGPAAPRIRAASGSNGRVHIDFVPAEPAERSRQVVLLRSDAPREAGLVVGAPVAGSAGAIEDAWVHAGQAYWYRLVAFDAEGNRSEESDAVQVRVAAPVLPAPAAPEASYTGQPAPLVRLRFAAPPPHARVLVQVQREDGRWQTLAGPQGGDSAQDGTPPGPKASYRIVYVDERGVAGPPSPAAVAR